MGKLLLIACVYRLQAMKEKLPIYFIFVYAHNSNNFDYICFKFTTN